MSNILFTRLTRPYINPLVHDLKYENIDLIKSMILTVVLLPFRIFIIIILVLISWFLAFVGLIGLSEQDLEREPLQSWRRSVLEATAFTMRLAFATGSFIYLRVKGEQATRSEAPILVVAPHSSFMDSMAIISTGSPSVVVRESSKHAIFIGKLVRLLQSIVVSRENSSSRRTTIEKIIERAKSHQSWPQILIFPEGTTTNRKALLKFKVGAFAPGVPIQPVLIRYPNRYDTFTWTWDGSGYVKLVWLTLTQFYNNFEVEFLPVYRPNVAEIADAKLFANNVRIVMANALKVPLSNFVYEDCKILPNARYYSIPLYRDILEVRRLRAQISGNYLHKEEKIASVYALKMSHEFITFNEFVNTLEFNEDDLNVIELFKLFDEKHRGKISFKNYLICVLFIAKQNELLIDFITSIARIYCWNLDSITLEQFRDITKHSVVLSDLDCYDLFLDLDRSFCGYIKFDDFLHKIGANTKYEYFFGKLSDAK